MFGFFRDGNFGFVPYAFESGATYTLSFDIKVLDGTADNWWMPIFFSGGKGDVVYVKQTNGEVYLQTYSLDSLNAKNRQTVVDNGDGTFRPEANVTRQDLAVMLVRYQQAAQVVLPTGSEAPAFADNDKIAPYAAEAVYVLQKAGVVSGSAGKFSPAATANWAQMGKMLSVFVISD